MGDHGRFATAILDTYIVGAFWFLIVLIIVFRLIAILRGEDSNDVT